MSLLAFYTLFRIVFITFNRNFVSESIPWLEVFVNGFRFDIVVAAWVIGPSLLFLLFRQVKVAGWLWFFLASLSFALEVIDIGYFAYTHRRSGVELLKIIGFLEDTLPNLPNYMRDFALGFIFWGALVGGLWYLRKRIFTEPPLEKKKGFWVWVVWVGTILGWMIAFRGGWGYKPLAVVDAAIPTCVECSAFVLNTTFSVVRALEQPPLPSWPKAPPNISAYPRPFRADSGCVGAYRYNVVVIILESFSAEYVEKGYAPFLRELISKGTSVKWGFACNYRSAEGIPAIVSSLPSWGEEPLVFTPYADRLTPGIGTLLQKWGYHTAFFHGGKNGTMLLDSYARAAGFSAYYGKNEYPFPERDYDGSWGIWDEPFLQFAAEKMNSFREPFGVVIFTLSSHHPYVIPEELRDSFPGGTLPIHRSVQYTDWALRQFFERVEKMAWAKRTLFVLTADHTGPTDEPYQSTRTFWVPMVFYVPGQKLPAVDSLGSHIDIVPTILEAIGYPYEVNVWGQSLWRFPAYRWAPMKPLPLYYEVLGREALLRYPPTGQPTALSWQGAPWQVSGPLPQLPPWSAEWISYLSSYGSYISPSIGRTSISSTTVPGGRCAMAHMSSATASPRMKRSGG